MRMIDEWEAENYKPVVLEKLFLKNIQGSRWVLNQDIFNT
jgi:hypothetical protein